MTEDIVPFDLMRMFIGDAPPLFLLEILFRSIVIYVYGFMLLRWIGGRSVAQFSLIEFLLVIALGSAVGDAMFYPEVPLLHAMLVITVVVGVNKGIDLLMQRMDGVKDAIDGEPVEVMRAGLINMEGLAERNISTKELFEHLRIKGVETLDQVRYAYMEPSGALSVYFDKSVTTGVAIIPPWEIGARQRDFDTAPDGRLYHCQICGADASAHRLRHRSQCDACGRDAWLPVLRQGEPEEA